MNATLAGLTVRRAAIAVVSIALIVYSLAPFAWIATASITPELRADRWSSARGIAYFPSAPTLQNYVDLFANVPFARSSSPPVRRSSR